MLSEPLKTESLEDEAPRYRLTENEPLWADMCTPPPASPAQTTEYMRAARAKDCVQNNYCYPARTTEYMGVARVSQYGVPGQIDIEVHCIDGFIEVGPFRMTVAEGCQLALAIMDGVNWFVREPERLRIAQDLAKLYRECEEAPIV